MIKQLVVKLDNKAGTLKSCVGLLAEYGVDIKALEVTERGEGEYGEAHLIVNNLSKAIEVLQQSNHTHRVEDVIVVEMDDRVGGLASVLDVFEKREINIQYLYAFVSRHQAKSLAVVRVNDIANAERFLADAGVPMISQTKIEKSDKTAATFKPSFEDHFGDSFIW